jgi:hypothetical protein
MIEEATSIHRNSRTSSVPPRSAELGVSSTKGVVFATPLAAVAWTHRFKPSGQRAEYELFDQVWVSPALAAKQVGSFIERRTRRTGDGSDHDPPWVVWTSEPALP